MIATKHSIQWLLIAVGLCGTLTQGGKCKKSGVNPRTCESTSDCTNGYKCTKSKCCQMPKLCLSGSPKEGSEKGEFLTCVKDLDCGEGYQCNINKKKQYSVCCKKETGTCTIPENGKEIVVGKTIKLGTCKKCECTSKGLECELLKSKKCPCEYEGTEYKSGDSYMNATHTCSVSCTAKLTKLIKCTGVCLFNGDVRVEVGETWESDDKCMTCKCKKQGPDCKESSSSELKNETHICTVMCQPPKTMVCKEKVSDPQWTKWTQWGMCNDPECGRKLRSRVCKEPTGEILESSKCEGEDREVVWCPLPDAPWPQWTTWGHWSACHPYECGPQLRSRMCIKKTGEVLESSKCKGDEDQQGWCPPCFGRSAGGTRVLRRDRHLFSGVVSLSEKAKQDGSQDVHFCGGNIVTNSWILTAAHCICGRKNECCSPDNKVSCDVQRNIQIIAGRLRLTKSDEAEQVKNISKAYVYHDFVPSVGSMRNDIALIRLADRLEFGDGNVEPGLLPTGLCVDDNERNETTCETIWQRAENEECQMAGWGVTPKTGLEPSPDMMKLEMTVQNHIPQEGIAKIKGVGGTPCEGDSGSPLMCGGDGHKPGPTLGLMSYVEMVGCYKGNISPTVATSIPEYLDWVTQHIVDRLEWGAWSCCSSQCGRDCSQPCLPGKVQRTRGCVGPVFGGHHSGQDPRKECFQKEIKECHTQYQCQGSQWGTWGDFSPCTMLCGKQVKIRGRQCLKPDGSIDPEINNCEPDKDTGVTNIEEKSCMQEITKKVSPVCEHPTLEGGSGAKQWLVTLYYNGELKCAGTLVSKSWILVAASCLIETAEDCPSEVGWSVRLGKLSITESDETESRKVSRIIFHPDFRALDADKMIFANNKAMVQLDTPVAFTENIKAACIKPVSKTSTCSVPQFQN